MDGYIIIGSRLYSFLPDVIYWDGNAISLLDIASAHRSGQPPCAEPYGDDGGYIPKQKQSKEWHVSRVLYFVTHPEEIKNIDIDNVCDGMTILPLPLITDGWHRVYAAKYLSLNELHVRYGGRMDLLDYLTGKSDSCPDY